jgi:outer membrane protein assembly factor BamB
LEFYNGTDLTRIDAVDVDGRVTWGPYPAGEHFLIHSETSGISAFDTSGKLHWTLPLEQIALIGPAIVHGEDILINSTAGSMYRISIDTGKLLATVDTGEPLSGPPFVFGSALLFPGSEGVLLAIPVIKTLATTAEGNPL